MAVPIVPKDIGLLEAMMATIGAVWSIGFVAYTFIFEHYRDAYSKVIAETEQHLKYGGKDAHDRGFWVERATELRKHIAIYEIVFLGYLLSGFAAVGSILFSAYVVARDDPSLVLPAEYAFGIVLILLGAFLSIEVSTSVRRLQQRRDELKGLIESP